MARTQLAAFFNIPSVCIDGMIIHGWKESHDIVESDLKVIIDEDPCHQKEDVWIPKHVVLWLRA